MRVPSRKNGTEKSTSASRSQVGVVMPQTMSSSPACNALQPVARRDLVKLQRNRSCRPRSSTVARISSSRSTEKPSKPPALQPFARRAARSPWCRRASRPRPRSWRARRRQPHARAARGGAAPTAAAQARRQQPRTEGAPGGAAQTDAGGHQRPSCSPRVLPLVSRTPAPCLAHGGARTPGCDDRHRFVEPSRYSISPRIHIG